MKLTEEQERMRQMSGILTEGVDEIYDFFNEMESREFGSEAQYLFDPKNRQHMLFLEIFLTPIYGPENYYWDGEISKAEAFRYWDAKLSKAGAPELYKIAKKSHLYKQLKKG